MASRRTEAVVEALPADLGGDDTRLGGGRRVHESHVGFRGGAETKDARDAGGARRGLEAGELRIVAVEHRDPTGLDPVEDLGLGVRDRGQRREEGAVNRRHVGHDRDVRAHHPRERRDFAGTVHADLKHAERAAGRHAG